MNFGTFVRFFLVSLVVFTFRLAQAQEGVGLTVHNKVKAFSGFTLYPEEGNATVKLLSMDGQVVHSWGVDATRARLLPNCHLLVVHGSKWGNKVEPWRSLRRKVREYDWNGKVVWEYEGDEILHHDVRRPRARSDLQRARLTARRRRRELSFGRDRAARRAVARGVGRVHHAT